MNFDISGAAIYVRIPTGIPILGDFMITETMVISWLVMILITGFCIWLTRDLKVENISRDITKLIESGVEFESELPEYYYTKLDEVKLDLIEKATANAKERIDIMSAGSGAKAGKLLSAALGVFQITAKNSGSESYSYDGYLDTSSRYKTANITVRLNYAAE